MTPTMIVLYDLATMLPVLQPCDVITRVTTSSMTSLPPDIADNSIGTAPYDYRGGGAESDCRLHQTAADQLTWAMPTCDDVISGCEQDGGRLRGRHVYPLYCGVCCVRMNGCEQARQHFEGRTHGRRVRLTSSPPPRFTGYTQVSNSCYMYIA